MIPFPTSEPTALVTPWFVAPGATPVELTAMNAVQWLRLGIEKDVEKHDVAAGGPTRG